MFVGVAEMFCDCFFIVEIKLGLILKFYALRKKLTWGPSFIIIISGTRRSEERVDVGSLPRVLWVQTRHPQGVLDLIRDGGGVVV